MIVVLLATVLCTTPLSGASPVGSPGTTAAGASGSGPCTTPTRPASFSGTLTVVGGPLSDAAAVGVNLTVSYDQQVTVSYIPNGTIISQNCALVSKTVATGANGAFSGSAAPPPESCAPAPGGGTECTDYASPFAPMSVVSATVPAGYQLSSSENGSTFALAWVAGLASLTVSPTGPTVGIAPGAAVTFVALPRTANGSASPLAVAFNWTLAGSGYAFAPQNGSATVRALVAGASATLNASASATAGPNVFRTPTVSINLTTIPTSITAGSIALTTFDALQPVSVAVTARGPSGYGYSAHLDPGRGIPGRNVSCSAAPFAPGAVSVRCVANVTYPTAGTSVLSVNVTNGFGSAVWISPILSVAPPPALSLDPAAPVGYVDLPIPLTLTAANGSGVLPYAGACFAAGPGPAHCSTSAGPVWTFAPAYSVTGNYSGQAWAIDAAGMNRSVTTAVRVVEPLSLGPLASAASSPLAGVATNLTVLVAGGALPGEVWWNASDLGAPVAMGRVAVDGPLSVPFVAPAAGPVRLSVTVRDALGSVERANLSLAVGPGPAASLGAATLPPSVLLVGQPVRLGWQALDLVREPVPSFGAPVDLVVTGAGGAGAPSWVNLSGLGALSTSPATSFAIPASAWSDGTLFVNLTPAVAGALTVRLEGTGLPGPAASVPLGVEPDLTHLRLYDPLVGVAGTAVNRTYWHVSDRFGDPVPGAYLYLEYRGGGSASTSVVPVTWSGPNSTGAWVNYSMPGITVGTMRLTDGAGDLLVGPVSLAPAAAAASGPALPALALVVLALAGASGAVATVLARPRRGPELLLPPSEEEAARQLAIGRAEVVDAVRRSGRADRGTVASTWAPDPAPEELDEWLASLVADGTLVAAPAEDGALEYALAPPPPETPRVMVDPDALERAVAAREDAVRPDDEADR